MSLPTGSQKHTKCRGEHKLEDLGDVSGGMKTLAKKTKQNRFRKLHGKENLQKLL